MKRIFTAIKIDPGVKLANTLAAFRDGLEGARIKWTPAGNLHLTLAFLGNTGEDRLEIVRSVLQQECGNHTGFEMKLKGAGVFKSLSDPNIIWFGVEKSDKLLSLGRSVISGFRDKGFLIESRDFNPHLTIGRVKHLPDKDKLTVLLEKYGNEVLQVVPVTGVILYESLLRPSGPVYIPLESFSLRPQENT